MQLYKLLEGVDSEYNHAIDGMEISGVAIDSNEVKPGDIFVCLTGKNHDGNDYVAEAITQGARAIVTERESELACTIKVEDARKAYALISKNLFEKACDSLKMIGVTGTNGKTTTVNLIAEILRYCGKNVATVGTMGIAYNGKIFETGFTTPDPSILHKHFLDMQKSGVEYVVMEASAHAIALKKLEGIVFDVGVLTNITQDHLDFFGDMDTYAETKLSFFDKGKVKLGLVCSDDPHVRVLLNNPSVPTISYGLDNPSDIFAINIDETFDKTQFICNCLDDIVGIKTNLVGKYNVENSLAAIGVCRVLGLDNKAIAKAIRYVNPVEGRFNVIKHPKCNIVIDYAHTPDGLENVLYTAKQLTKGNLIALFGCGGNRDKLKRPIMGKLASQYADKIFLTSDNPRDEDPYQIIHEIEEGVQHNVPCVICENRGDAIAKALDVCKKGDTLVIAGKGGEKYQEVKGQKIPYNDFDAVYKYFREHIVDIISKPTSKVKGIQEDEQS